MSLEPGSVPFRGSRVAAGMLVSGAVIGLVGNALHPHAAGLDMAETVAGIAASGTWVAIHFAILTAIILIVGGLIGVAETFQGTDGELYWRLGIAAALVGSAVVTVSTSIDGFVMKAVTSDVLDAPASGHATALAVAVGLKEADFGIWSIGIVIFFGAAFAAFGAAMIASRRYGRWLGWLAIVGAAGSTVAGMLQIAASGEVQAAETILLASTMLLTVWTFVLGVRVFRRPSMEPEPVLPLAAGVRG
jgi:hypothetical protein